MAVFYRFAFVEMKFFISVLFKFYFYEPWTVSSDFRGCLLIVLNDSGTVSHGPAHVQLWYDRPTLCD